MNTQNRLSVLKRMIKWSDENKDTWYLVTSIMMNVFEHDKKDYEQVFSALLEQQFYQVLFLMFCTSDFKMEQSVKAVYKEMFANHIDEIYINTFANKVLENIIAEIECEG